MWECYIVFDLYMSSLQIETLEKINENHVENHGKKTFLFTHGDGDPPTLYNE